MPKYPITQSRQSVGDVNDNLLILYYRYAEALELYWIFKIASQNYLTEMYWLYYYVKRIQLSVMMSTLIPYHSMNRMRHYFWINVQFSIDPLESQFYIDIGDINNELDDLRDSSNKALNNLTSNPFSSLDRK